MIPVIIMHNKRDWGTSVRLEEMGMRFSPSYVIVHMQVSSAYGRKISTNRIIGQLHLGKC